MTTPATDQRPDAPVWRIGDRVVFKAWYDHGSAHEPLVYEVRGVDGPAVWLARDGGHVTAKAHWLARAV